MDVAGNQGSIPRIRERVSYETVRYLSGFKSKGEIAADSVRSCTEDEHHVSKTGFAHGK